MRLLIHGAPPWAPSGYGIQTGLTAETLAGLGHEVAISAHGGVIEERPWHGIPVMTCAGKAYGNGVIAFNYRRWQADLLVIVGDLFTLNPAQFAGLAVMPQIPIDTDRLGVMDKQWLQVVSSAGECYPVAMSQHGAFALEAAGWGNRPVVEHAVAPGHYPDAEARSEWRKALGLPVDAFVIGKVAVNNEDDRKALIETLLAFADFARHSKRARLYLHTEAQVKGAPNLAYAAMSLNLRGKVCFADEDRRRADHYSTDDMRAVYNGCDVMDVTARGEGFCCPAIDALACGTPIIGSRGSAVTEKIRPEWGWLISGQPTWARHHNAWWVTPSVPELVRAYQKADAGAAALRPAAVTAAARWNASALREAWAAALGSI